MWLWLLAVIALLAIWAVYSLITIPLWMPIVGTVFVFLAVFGSVLFRRLRAAAAARALEREILKQAEQQALNARPDRRAEIIELQAQIKNGLQSLKQSKLGAQTRGSALYALPWYVIVGPPGAGKTTALKHSGLAFPYVDAQTGGGVRGVGGTRNCDWWFTNEAILLDTAGRYATQQDDHQEWLAFLDMLKKYRARKPINGVLVAISLIDVLDATEEQIDGFAKTMRARIHELMTRLEMVVPIYLVFTKTDLVGGFVEYWGDLRRAERAQIWGATFPLGAPMTEPARVFEGEFDQLVKTVHARAIRRIGFERQLEARQKIFQFPLEFQALRRNLSEFIGALFQQNAYQETPIFRGFYFTSGTQEGRALDRVVGAMARGFGLRPQQLPDQPQVQEPKSYFLADMFRRVVFPDQNVAARTAREVRRQLVNRVAFAATAFVVALALVVPAGCTYANNRELVKSTDAAVAETAGIDWRDAKPVAEKAKSLDKLRVRLQELDTWKADGAPQRLRWGMYTGDALYEPLRGVYLARLDTGFAQPTRAWLEEYLRSMAQLPNRPADQYNRDYDYLKMYLMGGDVAHLDVPWAAQRLTRVWATVLGARDDASDAALLPHVTYYLDLMKRGEVAPWSESTPIIERARALLLQAPQVDREYEALVRDANHEIPAVIRETVFNNAFGAFVTSKSRKNVHVDGAYTKRGWAKVRELLGNEQNKLLGEQWVLGVNTDHSQEEVRLQIERLRSLYFANFQNAWTNFLGDLDVQKPSNRDNGLKELNALSEPEWPYLRLLRTLNENVTLDLTNAEAGVKDATPIGQVRSAIAEVKEKIGIDGGAAAVAANRAIGPVERAFKPLTTFALPPSTDANAAAAATASASTGLAQYQQQIIAKLVGVLSDLQDSRATPDTKASASEFEQAFRSTSAILATQDGFTRPLLSPLLMNPITQAWAGVVNDAGGAAGGVWELEVWNKWHEKLEDRYPFTDSLKDAAIADFTEFFRPKTGLLWGFVDTNLQGAITQSGSTFIPSRRFKAEMAFNSAFLNPCLHRGADITKATFPAKGGEEPIVDFEVNLHSVSDNVAEVTFEIDGAAKTYRNTPEEWLAVRWPAKDAQVHGARVRVRGSNGLDEEIARAGDFGFFRMLDAADVKPGTAGGKPGAAPTLVATWELRVPRGDEGKRGAEIRMDVRPSSADNPLSKPLFFRGYNCPLHIVVGGR